MRFAVLAVALTLAASVCLAGEGRGGFSGTVVAESGTAEAGAAVVWARVPTASSSKPRFARQPIERGYAIADGAGRFEVTGRTSGKYSVCATSPNPGLLSTCEWRGAARIVEIDDGQPPTVNMALPRGCILTIRLHDKQSRLLKAARLWITACAKDGSFARARSIRLTPSYAEFQVTVPRHTDLLLNIEAPGSLTDGSGNHIDSSIPAFAVSVDSEAEIAIPIFMN